MILEDAASIKAALATMNPTAREATQLLTHRILQDPSLIHRSEEISREAFDACAISFSRAGYSIKDDADRFRSFIEDHCANVLHLAASIVLHLYREAERKRKWGWVGKAAAGVGIVGAAALGAFFG